MIDHAGPYVYALPVAVLSHADYIELSSCALTTYCLPTAIVPPAYTVSPSFHLLPPARVLYYRYPLCYRRGGQRPCYPLHCCDASHYHRDAPAAPAASSRVSPSRVPLCPRNRRSPPALSGDTSCCCVRPLCDSSPACVRARIFPAGVCASNNRHGVYDMVYRR